MDDVIYVVGEEDESTPIEIVEALQGNEDREKREQMLRINELGEDRRGRRGRMKRWEMRQNWLNKFIVLLRLLRV